MSNQPLRNTTARWRDLDRRHHLSPFTDYQELKGPEAGRMMHYFWDTVRYCVPPDQIVASLGGAGFDSPSRTVMGGILSEFVATRPS